MGINFRKLLNFAAYGLVYLLFYIPVIEKLLFKKRKDLIGFAFDYFAGNIKYLYEEMKNYTGIEVYFVTTIRQEVKELRASGVNAYYYLDIRENPRFLCTDVWVTSHGPNYIPFRGIRRVIPFYKGKRHSKWVDVWHGLSFKHADREKMLIDYDLGFVTSEFFQQYYSKEANLSGRLKIKGDSRTDPLVKKIWNKTEILQEMDVPLNRKNILYAPTWGHGKKKLFLPWGTNIQNVEYIEEFCKENNCSFLIRMHPLWNWGSLKEKKRMEERIKQSKYIFDSAVEKYPDVQRVLYIADVLITDWSSIANDFILLNRPIIFLDVELPVKEFVLEPEDRVGYVVKNRKEFFEKLQEALVRPNLFEEKRRTLIKKIYEQLDGNSSKRCAEEIIKLLKE